MSKHWQLGRRLTPAPLRTTCISLAWPSGASLGWLALFILATLPTFAQPGGYSSKDKKALKHYEAGVNCMRQRDADCAQQEFTKAAEADAHFVEPRLMLAELLGDQGRDQEAIARYKEVMAIAPRFHPSAQLHLADLEFRNGRYDDAERNYTAYMETELDPQRRTRARMGLDNCAFARRAIQQPVPFEPLNLGPGVNTADPEYYPCITADDRTLLFTRRIKAEDIRAGQQEDFFVSHRGQDDAWGPSRGIASVNTDRNEGAGTLSPDGRFIIFTACAYADGTYGTGRKGLGSCDLFISRRVGERWSPPENLGPPVNSRHWESQPSLASDGRTLYFVRGVQARDGVRDTDIYRTSLRDDGSWSPPEKLGPNINTPFQEESVQIHPDGRTLYFSSNGHPGMGGLDIYVSRKEKDGSWGQALNLGYPINTGADENSLLVSAAGDVAYFASDRPGGFGDLDLYSFELYPEARPLPVTYIRGHVSDRLTGAPLEADVELYDLMTGELATAAYSDPKTGEFLVCLPVGRDYALNAGAEGYLFHSETYAVPDGAVDAPHTLEVKLSPLVKGSAIALRNIFFNTASHELLPASNAELSKLTGLMKANPTLRIELGGHTDSVGKDEANMALSERRAQAVRDHLMANGIDGVRIIAKGYGRTKPIATNDTEEGRALNRRTEITVL